MALRKEDFHDLDFLSREELSSDGYLVYASGSIVHIVSSLVSGNKIVTTDFFLRSIDDPVQVGDRVCIYNAEDADGYYTVKEILNDYSFSVAEDVEEVSFGEMHFMHPPGAKFIGFDPTGMTSITSRNLQDAIKEIAINSVGISEATHENLDTLTHHIAEDGYSLVTYNANKVMNYTIYTDNTMNKKIREYQLSYNINPCHTQVSSVHIIQYNAAGAPVNTLTETFGYLGNKIVSITSVKT
jgi:hypothetical protein